MDIQRYALMIALALVGWMTLVEWTNFRQEHLAKANTDTLTQAAPDKDQFLMN